MSLRFLLLAYATLGGVAALGTVIPREAEVPPLVTGRFAAHRSPIALHTVLDAARPPERRTVVNDTVTVAGPYLFSKAGGGPHETVSFAYFTATISPGRRYIVRTQLVSGTLSSVDVRVNGALVATASEVQSPGGAARIVELPATDTIRAAVAGTNGATIRVTVSSVPDPSYVIAGPYRLSIINYDVYDSATFRSQPPPRVRRPRQIRSSSAGRCPTRPRSRSR